MPARTIDSSDRGDEPASQPADNRGNPPDRPGCAGTPTTADPADPANPAVLIVPGVYGRASEVWIARQVLAMRRHRPHVAAWDFLHPEQFGPPAAHWLDWPGKGRHVIEQFAYAATHLRLPWAHRVRAWRCRRIVRQVRPALIHVHFLWNADVCRSAARSARLPLLVTAHGSDVNQARVNETYRRSLLPTFAAAGRVIAVSRFIRGQLESLGCDPGRIEVLPLGAPAAETPAEPSGASETIEIVCVCSFQPVKGHMYLLRALAKARRRCAALRLTLLGDGPTRPACEGLADELSLHPAVRFEGWADETAVRRALAGAHIYAQHSIRSRERLPDGTEVLREEGLPISFVEAAAHGLPMVGTRVGGVPEICRDGRTGLLVEPEDVDAMAGALVRLGEDADLRARLGAQARQLAAEEYDFDRQLARLEDLYDRLARDPATGEG